MTTNSYTQWLSKLINCHKSQQNSQCPKGAEDSNMRDMKRREAVTEASEGPQNPFAGREYIKKMPYSSAQNFLTSDIGHGSPGNPGSADDIIPPPKNCYRLVMLGKYKKSAFETAATIIIAFKALSGDIYSKDR